MDTPPNYKILVAVKMVAILHVQSRLAWPYWKKSHWVQNTVGPYSTWWL